MPYSRHAFAEPVATAPRPAAAKLSAATAGALVFDDAAVIAQAETLPVVRNSPREIAAARVVVCGSALGADRDARVTDAAELLFALGIHPRSEPPRSVAKWRWGAEDEPEPPQPGEACGDKQGTRTGYNRHRRVPEDACQPCLDANAEYTRLHATHIAHRIAPCGTKAARRRHRRHEEACERCWPAGMPKASA
jgi:hypothetical protein